MLEVGDDTRSRFCVSLWPKRGSSVLAGDVLLLQNIKIVEFRNGLEGRASQISAVQVLLNSKDLVKQSGMEVHLFFVHLLTYHSVSGAIMSKFVPSLIYATERHAITEQLSIHV
jgi:hypothetical protein